MNDDVALADVCIGDLERLHQTAYWNGWDEICRDVEDTMTARPEFGEVNRGP